MNFLRFSGKRPRTYVRTFDYEEARRRVAAGETMTSVALSLGVDRRSVARAVHTNDLTSDVRPPAITGYGRRVVRGMRVRVVNPHKCPTCRGHKAATSKLCRSCRNDVRLQPPSLVKVPGRTKPVSLEGVALGRIVFYRGQWAVVEDCGNNARFRTLDFWDGPSKRVRANVVVDRVLDGWAEA